MCMSNLSWTWELRTFSECASLMSFMYVVRIDFSLREFFFVRVDFIPTYMLFSSIIRHSLLAYLNH